MRLLSSTCLLVSFSGFVVGVFVDGSAVSDELVTGIGFSRGGDFLGVNSELLGVNSELNLVVGGSFCAIVVGMSAFGGSVFSCDFSPGCDFFEISLTVPFSPVLATVVIGVAIVLFCPNFGIGVDAVVVGGGLFPDFESVVCTAGIVTGGPGFDETTGVFDGATGVFDEDVTGVGTFDDVTGVFDEVTGSCTFDDVTAGRPFDDVTGGWVFDDGTGGWAFDDVIVGSIFDDVIVGSTFDDVIVGSSFDDVIVGSSFDNVGVGWVFAEVRG
jgi:hypothetical protein